MYIHVDEHVIKILFVTCTYALSFSQVIFSIVGLYAYSIHRSRTHRVARFFSKINAFSLAYVHAPQATVMVELYTGASLKYDKEHCGLFLRV